MIISDILVASDMNPKYYKFIPVFIKAWKAVLPYVKINVILVYDSKKPFVLPVELELYKSYIILFPSIENIKTPFIAQTIRILYPALLRSWGGVLITDIDMIPMNSKYYVESIKDHSDISFICYRNILQHRQQLPICYNVATSVIWGNIFNIRTIGDVVNRLKYEYSKIKYDGGSGKEGWSSDQLILYREVMNWANNNNKLVVLEDKLTGFSRLDRIKNFTFDDDLKYKIEHDFFCDYHMKRPYDNYKELNDNIVNHLLNTRKIKT